MFNLFFILLHALLSIVTESNFTGATIAFLQPAPSG